MPTVRGGSLFPSMGAAPQPDSIASELESSLYSELSVDSGISTGDRMYVHNFVHIISQTAFYLYLLGDKSIFIVSSSLDQLTRKYSKPFEARPEHRMQVWIPINSLRWVL